MHAIDKPSSTSAWEETWRPSIRTLAQHLQQPKNGNPYDRQAPNVLPALLQQRDEVIDSQHDVTNQMVLSHANVPNSNTETQNLLQLELDSALDIGDLLGEVLGVGDGGGELSGLGETGAEQTWDLLDELFGRDEGVVFARELLDEFLVLVKLFQVVDGHGLEGVMLGAIDVVLVTEDAVSMKRLLAFLWTIAGAVLHTR